MKSTTHHHDSTPHLTTYHADDGTVAAVSDGHSHSDAWHLVLAAATATPVPA